MNIVDTIFSKKGLVLVGLMFFFVYFVLNKGIDYAQKMSLEKREDIVEAKGIKYNKFYIGQNADAIITGKRKKIFKNGWWEVKEDLVPEGYDSVYVMTYMNTRDIERVSFLKNVKNKKECVKVAKDIISKNVSNSSNFYYDCIGNVKTKMVLIFYNHEVFEGV